MTVGDFGEWIERLELIVQTERSCHTCANFSAGGGDYGYEEPAECWELPQVDYLKNFPFKNGCKRYQVKDYLIMTDREYEEMARG